MPENPYQPPKALASLAGLFAIGCAHVGIGFALYRHMILHDAAFPGFLVFHVPAIVAFAASSGIWWQSGFLSDETFVRVLETVVAAAVTTFMSLVGMMWVSFGAYGS